MRCSQPRSARRLSLSRTGSTCPGRVALPSLLDALVTVRDQQHPTCPRRSRDPLQLPSHGGIVGPTGPLRVNELAEHHLRSLQPRDLHLKFSELFAQPLGTVGQHQPPLHHPRQHVRHP